MANQNLKKQNLFLLLNFLEKPQSYDDIVKYLNVSEACAFRYIKQLKESKLIYICSYIKTEGKLRRVYVKGQRYDEPAPQNKYTKYYKYMSKKFIPRPDMAAAWLFNPVEGL